MIYLLVSIAASHALWGMFVICMALKRVRDEGKLTVAMKVFGYPFLFIGLAVDLLVNVFIGSALFLEIPRELTLSSRLWRHSTQGSGYRQKLALWLRVNLLDAIDPSGIHTG
jgi:hypothetical protein